jgi:putative OPT family oligopeptide transporter
VSEPGADAPGAASHGPGGSVRVALPAAAPARRQHGLVPYVPAGVDLDELTPRALLLGALLSVAFGMVNAYLGLRVGLTVSASIPSAVISMGVLRGVLRRGTILENNVVHALGSAGESLAGGVVFTVPALVFLGLEPTDRTIALLGVTAGLLGIFAMIPMRRDLTVHEHVRLPYPEGTACAEVLIAGDRGGASARPVLVGLVLGVAFLVGSQVLGLWSDRVVWTFSSLHKATIGFDLTPIFLGAGYLIGPGIAAVMACGGLLAWTVLVPLADVLAGTPTGLAFGIPADAAALDATALWKAHVRFVGAGAVATGGLVSLLGVLPTIARAVREAARSARAALGRELSAAPHVLRTDRDLPAWVPPAGVLACLLALWLVPDFGLSLPEAFLAVAFAIFFVVVSARIVGLVGTTSQPVSGMTITALLATAWLLKATGHEGAEATSASIVVGAVVAISVALAGDLSQDLKTAALVGATPSRVQVAQIAGTLAAALRAGWVLLLLHRAYGLGSDLLPAPQARLMATLVDGVARGELPVGTMSLGAGLALAALVAGASPLAFAIGLYLPVTTTAPLLLGGLVRGWLDARARPPHVPRPHESIEFEPSDPAKERAGEGGATLLASGMIAGEALAGIAAAAAVLLLGDGALRLREPGSFGVLEPLATVAAWLVLVAALARGDRGGDGGQQLDPADRHLGS